jgi:hypothetical protein
VAKERRVWSGAPGCDLVLEHCQASTVRKLNLNLGRMNSVLFRLLLCTWQDKSYPVNLFQNRVWLLNYLKDKRLSNNKKCMKILCSVVSMQP